MNITFNNKSMSFSFKRVGCQSVQNLNKAPSADRQYRYILQIVLSVKVKRNLKRHSRNRKH